VELTPVRTGAVAAFAAALIATPTADAASRKRVPDDPQCPTAGMHVVSISRALDGGAFATADGREVKLAGIVPPGKDGNPATPIEAQAAKDALDDLLKGGTVSLAEAATDRYGRAVAQVFVDDMWVQGSLLRRGLVRAAPDEASAMCAKRLLAAEGEARAAKAGAWGTRTFAILDARSIKARPGSFQIVEGTVTTSAVNRGRAYVNFGADYRSDFTITVPQPDMAAFRRARLDLRKLAGKRLRVRGWIDFYNGPEMEITTPAAIEVLNENSPGESARAVPLPNAD
jgi:endonuclease YncB( thermonuclease family)